MATRKRRTTEAKPTDRFARRATVRRRAGIGARCRCGETRAAALVKESQPTVCQECQRTVQGKATTDAHHVAGEANDATTIYVPTNDHVAELSERQHDWPEQTLQNPDGDPLLRAAACLRGGYDTVVYLVKRVFLWIPRMLETASEFLTQVLGRFYWRGTPLQAFAPGR